ncbi:MAG: hypothetical protein AB7G87_06665 [Clostridia bacterium]
MLHTITQNYTDQSTQSEFYFIFYCDLCNHSWKSVPIPFSRGKLKGISKFFFGRASPLWKKEHQDAFERANHEAMLHFNRCPVCKRWVCDEDFPEEENQCSECSKKS